MLLPEGNALPQPIAVGNGRAVQSPSSGLTLLALFTPDPSTARRVPEFSTVNIRNPQHPESPRENHVDQFAASATASMK